MASNELQLGQHYIQCNHCQQPATNYCRRCACNLCHACLPDHFRLDSATGHEVVNYAIKEFQDIFFCDLHPKYELSLYCQKCDKPICVLCASVTHKSHDLSELTEKIRKLLEIINEENERLLSLKQELVEVLAHTEQRLSSIPRLYQQAKDAVTSRGEEWHKKIEDTVRKLHEDIDQRKEEHSTMLQKQKLQCEETLQQIENLNSTTMSLSESANLGQIQTFIPIIKMPLKLPKIKNFAVPAFCRNTIDQNNVATFFGYLKLPQDEEALFNFISRNPVDPPLVITTIDSGFRADGATNCLFSMVFSPEGKVYMGGLSKDVKKFDLEGTLMNRIAISTEGMYLSMHKGNLIFTDLKDKSVMRVSEESTVDTMFRTEDWSPLGITSTASDDLLVCLRKDNQSKVVRYNSSGAVLQEIQFYSRSQGQPLYKFALYVTENTNGDVIVSDFKAKAIIVVDRLGVYRFIYPERTNEITVGICGVVTDSMGHIIVTDSQGNSVHMLDKYGRFLRFIAPEKEIASPRAVCIVNEEEILVGESLTGLVKRIKYQE